MTRQQYLSAHRQLRAHLLLVIEESEQIRRNIERWNATDDEPMDCGGDIASAALARQILALVDAGDCIPEPLWKRYREQLKANAEL